MTKITIIGAGSAEFAAQLMTDILVTPGLPSGVFGLVDIDPHRLDLAHRMAHHLIQCTGRGWTVEASTDRSLVLPGSDYVISTIEVAGLPNVRHDYEIPLKYGVDQCIGDTIGPGGLFKALRTLPAWLSILKDVERLAPNALVMNYTNPMSLAVLAGLRASSLPIVGLCHSIPHTAGQLAHYLDLPLDEIEWQAGGINHLAWFTRLERHGQDLYPRLRERAQDPAVYEQDPVRFELLLHLGAFPAESSGHVSEYLSYFRKRPGLLHEYSRPGYLGESGFYARNWPRWREEKDARLQRVLAHRQDYPFVRSPEYASFIIEAMQTHRPAQVYANVLNANGRSAPLIDNLPANGVVEVPCRVDGQGLHPQPFGPLPAHLAALSLPHMAFHDLVVTAVLEQDREAAVHALALDPLTSAVCSLAEIRRMFDEMAAAQKPYLPDFLTGKG